jgi:hypothetical protein
MAPYAILRFAVLLILSSAVPLVAQSSRVAYFPFNGSASDASGNGHHGTVNGALLTVDRFGTENSAYYFDGGSYIAVPHSPDLAFGAGSAFTISAWVLTCSEQANYTGIVCKGPQNMLYPGYQLMIMNRDRIGMQVGTANHNFEEASGTRSVDNGIWRHFVMTADHRTNRVQLFLDGRLESTTIVEGMETALAYTDSLRIGVERNEVVYLRGSIDDVAIYSRVLDQNEIDALYHEGGFTPQPRRQGGTYSIGMCGGDSVTLSLATAATSYSWSTGATTRSIRVGRTGVYYGRSIDDMGCSASDTFVVTAAAAPAVQLARSIQKCGTESVRIGAPATGGTPPYRYQWSPSVGLDDPTQATPNAQPSIPTTYRVTITDARGCTITDSVVVSLREGPRLQMATSFDICRGAAATLAPLVTQGTPPYAFAWSPAVGLNDPSSASPTAAPDQTQTYTVTVTDASGCASTQSVTVNVRSGPMIAALSEIRHCGDQRPVALSGTASGGVPPYTYRWSPSTGLSSDSEPNPTATPQSTTVYTLTVTDANGCTSTAQTRVVVSEGLLEITRTGLDLGTLSLGTERCDTITIRNRGATPMDLSSSHLLQNRAFSIPPSQLPIILAPGESRQIIICFDGRTVGDHYDTLSFGNECDIVLLRASVEISAFTGGEDCRVRLRVRPDANLRRLTVGAPQPNPVTTTLVVPVELIVAGDATISGELFDLSGRKVASGEFRRSSASVEGLHVIHTGTIEISVAELPSALYLLRIDGADAIPVVVQR